MRRILLSTLVIGILLLGACATPTTAPEAEAPPTEETTPEAETPPSETQSEKLPYSWTEGVFLITIEEFFKYDEPGSIAENYDWYKLRVSYKNTSHMTTKANINIGDFKLKTDKGNLYDLKYIGCESCYDTFDPEATHDYPPCTFRIQKGEKPVELWFYKTIEVEYGWPKYAEEPSIIFKLETRPTEQTAPEAETTVPETQIEKLPHSWSEGVLEITVHKVFKSETQLEELDRYRVRIEYKNTSYETTPVLYLRTMGFKLKTDAHNIYDAESAIGAKSHKAFLPQESYEDTYCFIFEIWKGEKPVELWLYSKSPGSGELAEQPSIIFRLET